LHATRRIPFNSKRKKKTKINKKRVPREAVEIRSQSIVEKDDGFVEEDCLVDWSSPTIYDIYPNDEVSSIYQVHDKSTKIEVFDLEVDFLGVYAILSTTFNQSCDEIYKAEMNFLLKSERGLCGFFGDSHGMWKRKGTRKAWHADTPK
jgi:hypothetical protein